MSRNPFDILKKSNPSQASIQDARRRMNQQPAIHDAQATADSAVAGAASAKQRADEAHSRFTKTALDAAHLTAEQAHARSSNPAINAAHTKAEEAFFRATNPSLDSAHVKAENANTNAESRLSRPDGGIVGGVTRFNRFQEQYTLVNATVSANSTITYAVGSLHKHITMAQIYDGDTNGWIMLPTVGESPVFIKRNTATQFTMQNDRTTAETVRARLWEDA